MIVAKIASPVTIQFSKKTTQHFLQTLSSSIEKFTFPIQIVMKTFLSGHSDVSKQLLSIFIYIYKLGLIYLIPHFNISQIQTVNFSPQICLVNKNWIMQQYCLIVLKHFLCDNYYSHLYRIYFLISQIIDKKETYLHYIYIRKTYS